MLARFGIALLIFFGGMNLIWLGCHDNGSNNRFNPIWGFVDGIVTLEKYALCASLIFGLIAVVFVVIQEVPRSMPTEKPDYEIVRENRIRYQEETKARDARAEVHRIEANQILDKQLAEQKANAFAHPSEKPRVEEIIPQKPKPTPEELKQKAIQDILGR